MTQPSPARALALAVLERIERTGIFADLALEEAFRASSVDARDRALAVELVYSVLRHRGTLDWRIGLLSTHPLTRLPSAVCNVLRLGSYQLLYLDRIPPSAAVNDAVTLAKSAATSHPSRRDWSGLVNAILRRMTREPAPAWPDPSVDPVAALAIRYSCPSWLAARWMARYGYDQAARLCAAAIERPPLTLRTNTLRTTRESLAHALRAEGLDVVSTAVSPVGLTLAKCGPVPDLPGFANGWFYVEDEAAQLVSLLLAPQPGERVLDACAAPGGKATHLAALMHDRGLVVAADAAPDRLVLLRDNCRRLGLSIVAPLVWDWLAHDPRKPWPDEVARLLADPFDRILVDAPCSALGVLRRHPEAKWQKQEERFRALQQRQETLLDRIWRLLRPGGTLVYSTCSTEPEENDDVIESFCQRTPGAIRESAALHLPASAAGLVTAEGAFSSTPNPYAMDGFFAVRLRKAPRA